MAIACAHKEQARRCEYATVQSAESGQGHGKGHYPRETTQNPVSKGNGNCIGSEQLVRREHGEVGNVGQHVDDGHHGQRYVDCSRQVSERIFQFFSDKVQVIPVLTKNELVVQKVEQIPTDHPANENSPE